MRDGGLSTVIDEIEAREWEKGQGHGQLKNRKEEEKGKKKMLMMMMKRKKKKKKERETGIVIGLSIFF